MQQPASPVAPASGQVARSSVGQAGLRLDREQAGIEGLEPLARIPNRIQNRVQSRLRNRIDRTYDPQADASAFATAEDQARTAGRERR